jgi:hypothetical protein
MDELNQQGQQLLGLRQALVEKVPERHEICIDLKQIVLKDDDDPSDDDVVAHILVVPNTWCVLGEKQSNAVARQDIYKNSP